eukprot:TRINITY_DN13845_c0_g1_i1.p1 TRINITY_DN13845_c0_g1~~TRINITY_DN13845_c0_g1_i1.p1  ORF type:complete len:249 (-),score=44.82 TRINITY_DN13845_c0_g1_i1:194-838(-)
MQLGALISDFLSVAIVGGSLILKVPQILYMVRSKSAENLSRLTFATELFGYILLASYSFASGNRFVSYGENVIIAVQSFVIVFLISRYQHPGTLGFFFAVACPLLAFIAMVVTGTLSASAIGRILSIVNVPQLIISRVPQIYNNYTAGSVGAYSYSTAFLQWAGTAARVFTTAVSLNDPRLLGIYILSFTFNSILLAQCGLDYLRPDAKRKKLV